MDQHDIIGNADNAFVLALLVLLPTVSAATSVASIFVVIIMQLTGA